jgi:hypothetical protein
LGLAQKTGGLPAERLSDGCRPKRSIRITQSVTCGTRLPERRRDVRSSRITATVKPRKSPARQKQVDGFPVLWIFSILKRALRLYMKSGEGKLPVQPGMRYFCSDSNTVFRIKGFLSTSQRVLYWNHLFVFN